MLRTAGDHELGRPLAGFSTDSVWCPVVSLGSVSIPSGTSRRCASADAIGEMEVDRYYNASTLKRGASKPKGTPHFLSSHLDSRSRIENQRQAHRCGEV